MFLVINCSIDSVAAIVLSLHAFYFISNTRLKFANLPISENIENWIPETFLKQLLSTEIF